MGTEEEEDGQSGPQPRHRPQLLFWRDWRLPGGVRQWVTCCDSCLKRSLWLLRGIFLRRGGRKTSRVKCTPITWHAAGTWCMCD